MGSRNFAVGSRNPPPLGVIPRVSCHVSRSLTLALAMLTRAGYTPIELRRAYTIYWRLRMRYNLCVLNAGHCAYAAEHIRTGTVPKAVDAMLSIKPIVTPLTKE